MKKIQKTRSKTFIIAKFLRMKTQQCASSLKCMFTLLNYFSAALGEEKKAEILSKAKLLKAVRMFLEGFQVRNEAGKQLLPCAVPEAEGGHGAQALQTGCSSAWCLAAALDLKVYL